MAQGADERRRSDEPTTEQKGILLRPATTGVLRQALNHYLAKERDFVGVYFPNVVARGYASYDDVFQLSDDQADALRPILAESITHFHVQAGREEARNTHLTQRTPIDESFVPRAARKANLWTDALKNLCETFGLEPPI